jgi:hypothetical protein
MFKLLELAGAFMVLAVKVDGAKAATVPNERAAIERENFIVREMMN